MTPSNLRIAYLSDVCSALKDYVGEERPAKISAERLEDDTLRIEIVLEHGSRYQELLSEHLADIAVRTGIGDVVVESEPPRP